MDISRFRRPPRRWLAEILHLESGKVLPDNFHVINPELRIYRSSQPGHDEFMELKRYGFRSILNLRSHHSDLRALDGTGLREYRLRTHILSETDMIAALRIIRAAEKPLLIHCWHGSDRTGAVAAGCRIVFEQWSFDDALREFLLPEYGHHRHLYRRLPRVLATFDWAAIAAAVNDKPMELL